MNNDKNQNPADNGVGSTDVSASEMPAITVARELSEAAKRADSVIGFQHMQTVFLLRHIKGAIIALEHSQSPASVHRVLETLRTVHASERYEMNHLALPLPNTGYEPRA